MMLALARWWTVLIGGVLLGAGLVLHGQIACAHYLRDEVQGTFFLWRGIGQITFIFQDDFTKAALWMNEVPDTVLAESDRAAWTLLVVGGVVTLSSAFFRRARRRRRRK